MADKIKPTLLAASLSAILAVYAAGYSRTREAAEALDAQSSARRPAPAPVPDVVPPATEMAATASAVVVPGTPEKSVVTTTTAPATEVKSDTVADVEPAAIVVDAAPVAVAPPTPVPTSAPAPAPEPPPAPTPAPAQAKAKWKDGSYTGWGDSRHGDIQATVVIDGGRIQKAVISQCNTRYSCDVIEMLPPQVAQRQAADVDYVSRATESANAFYYAVVDALNKAKIEP
jgi:uncharacterized protein with FMN-binding domain